MVTGGSVGRALPAVLLGGSANALSAARSLHHHGVDVHAFDDGLGASPVRHSRSIRSWTPATSLDVQAGWVAQLAEMAPAALIPCCDDAVEAIADHRADLLRAGHRVPPGDDEVRRTMLDKAGTLEVARRAGVGAPAAFTVRTTDELFRAVEQVGFPCGLKPLHAHRFTRANDGVKGITVRDRQALRGVGAQLLGSGHEILVTEIIPGDDPVFSSYNTYIDSDGRPLFEITKQKLRQYPIDFGLGTFHRTIDLPEVAEVGRRFLREAGLEGFGNVEFRRDARDGQLKIIECNVRLTAANELLTRAGCDVADIVYRRTVGEPVEPVIGFTEGLRMFTPFRDTRAFLAYRDEGSVSWSDWLGDVVPPPRLPLFAWADPMPSVRTGIDKLRRKLGPRPGGRADLRDIPPGRTGS